MTMILRILFLSVAITMSTQLLGQELNCKVTIDLSQMQSQDKPTFDAMKESITRFMNTTKWTDDTFTEEERINCGLLITLKQNKTKPESFEAIVQIQSFRPIHNTSYESPLLLYFDKSWAFDYKRDTPFNFSENNIYSQELPALLAYFAYIFLAYDYDTFSLKGGSPYILKAFGLINNLTSGSKGWNDQSDILERYWLTENMNSVQFEPYREALYLYHRKGMDVFESDPEAARLQILAALEKISVVREVRPLSITLNAFFDAKFQEIIHVFSMGDESVRTRAVNLLVNLDPSHMNQYKRLVK